MRASQAEKEAVIAAAKAAARGEAARQVIDRLCCCIGRRNTMRVKIIYVSIERDITNR